LVVAVVSVSFAGAAAGFASAGLEEGRI
jgi:hypothetical protein